MPSASTISDDGSSTATESSLLLRARPVSVALKNSKLMVWIARWRAWRRVGPRSSARDHGPELCLGSLRENFTVAANPSGSGGAAAGPAEAGAGRGGPAPAPVGG